MLPAEIVHAYIEDVFNAHDIDAADRYIEADFVSNNPQVGDGLKGFKDYFSTILEAFPDLWGTVEDTIVEGSKVVVRMTWRGTHRGELLGLAPTGRTVAYKAIDIYRLDGDKIAEHWDVADALTLLQQLGVVGDSG